MHRVHTAQLTKADKRAIWDKLVQQFMTSGKSMRVFCEEQGLKYEQLNYYVNTHKKKQKGPSQFISLGLAATTTADKILIETMNLKITIPCSIEQRRLQNIFMAINELC